MMVRSVSVNYSNKYNLSVPGFLPNVGDVFGQGRNGSLAAGLDFAFGFTDDGYIERAARKGWLLMADSVTTPATSNLNESWQLRATLEPFTGVKIDLNATRTSTCAKSVQYMFNGMPTTQTGSFQMTTISIGTAFEKLGNPDKGYKSAAFSRFVSKLETYRQRIEAMDTHTSVYSTSAPLAALAGSSSKVRVAFLLDKHDTIGIDAVAM